MSSYWKKRLKEFEDNNKKSPKTVTPSSYWEQRVTEFEKYNSKKDDIAPVKPTVTQDDEKWYEGWFKKGDDDTGKAVVGTAADAGTDFLSGIVGMGEKIVDGLAWLGATLNQGTMNEAANNELMYNAVTGKKTDGVLGKYQKAQDEVVKKTDEFMAKDLYDEEKIAKQIIAGVSSAQHMSNIAQSGAYMTPEKLAEQQKIAQQMQADTLGYLDNEMEDDSVFDTKTDSLVQSGGQLAATMALQAAGVPWWVTSGVTTFGAETENALKEGADHYEAGVSGAISAAAEIATEKIAGISFGGKTFGDELAKQLGGAIANKFARASIKLGIDATGEGLEEVITEGVGRFGQWLTYRNDEELAEMLGSEEAMDAYIEAFIGGAALGGTSNVVQTGKSFAQGVDPVTELTTNEQKVVDKVYQDALNEAKKDGKKLTAKEKSKLYDQVMNDFEKGYISTDTIEEALGGDTYKSYRDTVDNEDALREEFNTLNQMKQGEMTGEQIDRRAELKQQLEDLKTNSQRDQLRQQLDDEMFSIVKDTRLVESYNEKSRRGQAFEADLSKYDEKQQKVIQSAIDSGLLNNTNRTHEFVDLIAKISADKGVSFDFTDNTKLKESGFAVDGATVNGYVNEAGDITLNIQSAKSINSVTGHEITHVLEGTELYTELQKVIEEYAKTKGEYDTRLEALTKLYEGKKGYETDFEAKVRAELTADLVGDYLFTDADFVHKLSTENRNLFQKIYDEIKYLVKIATAGSKEARELEKVKKAFEDAYRANGKTDGVKNSLSDNTGKELSKGQQDYFKDSKMRDDDGNLMVMYHGSQDAGFHEFNGKFSDDGTSFFFVDRNDVAATYSGTSETYEAKTIRTAEDMNNFLAEIGYDQYEAVERDGKFELLEDGDHVAWSDTAQGIYEEFCWYESVGEGDANYKVYLNLKNPLVVDAEGRNWNNVSREYSQEIADKYNSLTADEKAALTDLAEWEDFSTFRYELKQALGDNDAFEKEAYDEYASKIRSAYEKLSGDDFNLHDLFSIASDNFSEESIKQFAAKQMNTRDYAKRAKEQGYDGVIFKNIVDNGGYSNGSEGASTVAIAFDSNQIKSTANANPTKDADIRYSLSEETDTAYMDAVNRGDTDAVQKMVEEAAEKAMPNSKVRDDNGNLRLVYHGRVSEFNVFDRQFAELGGDFGKGYYFTSNEYDVDANYANEEGPDLRNRIARYADKLEYEDGYEDLSYGEREQIARDKFITSEPNTVTAYLNMENPVYITPDKEGTFLDFNENYNEETDDFDEPEGLLIDFVEALENNAQDYLSYRDVDFSFLYEYAYDNGGVLAVDAVQVIKHRITDELTDENGDLAVNEVIRLAFEEIGFDGIIDTYVYYKFRNMGGMDSGTTHYIVFDSNQIKSADLATYDDNGNLIPLSKRFNPDNNDIRYSLSPNGETAPTYGNYNVTGKDIALENVAPVQDSVQDATREVTDVDYAPAKEADVTAMAEESFASIDDADAPPEREIYNDTIPDTTTLDNKALKGVAESVRDVLALNSKETKAVQEIVQKYSTTELPSRDVLAEEIRDKFGERTWIERNEELVEIKRDIRKEPIAVSERIKSEYPEYGAWMRKQFGKVRFRKDGLPVDSAYQELAEIYPDMFPADIVNEADQLNRIVEVANMDVDIDNSYELTDEDVYEAADIIAAEVGKYKEAQLQKAVEAESKKAAKYLDAIAPVATEKITEKYEAIKPKAKKEPRMARATPTEQARAEILTEEPKTSKKKKGLWSRIKNSVLDKGMVFEDLSLATGNRELQARWNSIRYADGKAQRLMGEGNASVKSLNSIREAVEKTGKTKQFYEYLYHKHNADRMTLADRYEDVPNKPVFGDSVTARESNAIIAELERKNPSFRQYANDVYDYMTYLREQLVDGGVISSETAKLWQEMYPHYVPIRRAGDTGLNINVPLDTGRTGVNAPIKGATGGSRDILPLFDTMGQRTIQTYKAIAKNRFGVELKNTLHTTIESDAVGIDDAIDSIDTQDGLLQEGKNGKKPTFTVFENGEKVTFEITDEMYDAMKPTSEALAYTNKTLNTISNIRRGTLTEYNPWFMLKNAVKDVQDVLINSQHATKTYAAFPKAIKQMATNGHWYQEYMDNGGDQNTYFDNETNTFEPENKKLEIAKKVTGLDAISKANNIIERLPRLAEYIASREAGRSVDVSMLDAARVTTNFAAGGDLAKYVNRNGATFLNASIQGAVQQARNIREAKANGLRGWAKLAGTYALAGLPAVLLNGLIWDDDEEYEELSDYVKQNYYIVGKYGDGKFVRIPKGRTVAVIQNAFEQMQNAITGNDEVDLKAFVDLVVTNLAPNNPIDNNILSPIIDVAKNEAWYGEDLVPTRLQDLPAEEQYDESTDSISRWLGETLDYSPYKINYLLDQYSGVIGDTFLPMLTPEAESGDNSFGGNMIAPLKDMFSTDSVMNNQNVSDFYDTVDEVTTNAKSSKATDEDVLKSKYMNSVNSDLGELYGRKREIQNSDLPDDVKYNQVREIQRQIDEMAKEALETYGGVSITGDYATVGDRYYHKNDKDEWVKVTDDQLEKQNEVTIGLGISPAEYWGNKDEYDMAYEYPEKYAFLRENGLTAADYKDMDENTKNAYTWASKNPGKVPIANAVAGGVVEYRQYTSDLYDIRADKDENGESISGSAKEKKREYIFNLDLDYGQQAILYRSLYDSKDDKAEFDGYIFEYLESRDDISWEDEKTILEELGFTVTDDGTVYW